MASEPVQELCPSMPVDPISDGLNTPDDLNPQYRGARLISATENPQQGHHWMVTMVNRWTGAEELLDIICEGGSFKDLAQEVRRHFNYDWEIFEWFDPEVPF